MKRLLKIFLVIIAVVGGGFYVVTNHSVKEELYLSCKGDWFEDPETFNTDTMTWGKHHRYDKLAFRFQIWRWWLKLWNDSDGVGYSQSDAGDSDYFDQVHVNHGWNDIVFSGRLNGGGEYFNLSKSMQFDSLGRKYRFRGKCVETDNN